MFNFVRGKSKIPCFERGKAKILTTGICGIFRGLKFESDVEIGQKGAFCNWLGRRIMFLSGKRPTVLGIHGGALSPCPTSPNCVLSQATDRQHAIAPFSFKADPAKEMGRIHEILRSMTGVTVIAFEENYLYAECRSLLLGFVDDLEFFWDKKEKVCHVRSASRLGYSDMGKNRRRVEFIRRQFEKESS